jgi:hypothetical protein
VVVVTSSTQRSLDMPRETVAQGIKRRMAERAKVGRARTNLAVQIAIWSGVTGFMVTIMALAASYGLHRS